MNEDPPRPMCVVCDLRRAQDLPFMCNPCKRSWKRREKKTVPNGLSIVIWASKRTRKFERRRAKT